MFKLDVEWHREHDNRKFLLALVLACLVLGGIFAAIYIDVRTKYISLVEREENNRAYIRSLQSLIHDLINSKGIEGLSPVQIYNRTFRSVVLVENRRQTLTGTKIAEGSGFVYSTNYIVTNYHVVEGYESAGTEIWVRFYDGTYSEAEWIAADKYSDLAVLKVDIPDGISPILIGNSTELKVGEPIYAIGHPFQYYWTLTAGVVSQLERTMGSRYGFPIADLIQFDAAVNPGNSGGPLLNSLGEVVGVVTAIVTETGNFSGIGFAVSSAIMQRVVPSLIEKGHYSHPWVGLGGLDMTMDLAEDRNIRYVPGFLVEEVYEDSPAEQAGFQVGDIITQVDNRTVLGISDILVYLERYKSPGDEVVFTVVRDDQTIEISLVLGERPEPS